MTCPRRERDTAKANVTARMKKPARIPPAMIRLFATWPVVSALGASTATRMREPSIPGAANVA